ncbi:MAG: DUF6596 domain-containing protein, partial [Myxococcota bacterium]
RRQRLLEAQFEPEAAAPLPDALFPNEVRDDLLRMLFLCCDEAIPPASQIVFALKTLCGFSVEEIAARLFTTEANVYKRWTRARGSLRLMRPELDLRERPASRLPAVHAVIYLLFTEGYLSSRADETMRRELCDEAIRLGEVLADHPIGQVPSSYALLALMHLHAARMSARDDGAGGLLLLEEQDRSLWDQEQIARGLAWLERSASGAEFTRYHAEAGIAAEHCMAPRFAETRWDRVAESYAMLERLAPSPLHRLNRAVAVAEWKGAEAGHSVLEEAAPPAWLANSYLWAAVSSDLHRRCGRTQEAMRLRARALELAPNRAVRTLLSRRL